MKKWADYAITNVRFEKEKKHIEQVLAKKDLGDKLDDSSTMTRIEVVRALESGTTFTTTYKKDNKWLKGDNVNIVTINNKKFIRTDGNDKEEDNLGELPEF